MPGKKKIPAKKKNMAKFKSPQQRQEEKNQALQKAGPQLVKFIHIVPEEGGIEGFITIIEGRAEVAMTDPFWTRHVQAHLEYMNKLDLVGMVFKEWNMKNPYDINFNNRNSFPYKGVATITNMAYKQGEEMDHAYMKEWFTSEVIPALRNLGTLNENFEFDLDSENAYVRVPHWGPLLRDNDIIEKFIKNGPCKEDICQENKIWYPQTFYKFNKAYLYSIFPRGQVPLKVIKKHGLRPVDLDPADAGTNSTARYLTSDSNVGNNQPTSPSSQAKSSPAMVTQSPAPASKSDAN